MDRIALNMTVYLLVLYIILISAITQTLMRVLENWIDSWIHTPSEILNNIQNIYEIKDVLSNIDNIERLVFFQCENNRSNLKIKSLYGNSEYADDWVNTSVDSKYIDILKNISSSKGYYDFITNEEADCWLKKIYQRENIKYSRIYFISNKYDRKTLLDFLPFKKSKKLGFYYISISNTTGNKFTSSEELLIQTQLLKLKTHLSYE